MAEWVIVKAKIKDLTEDFNVAGDVPEALNEKVTSMIKEAVERARANGRRTVMAKDF